VSPGGGSSRRVAGADRNLLQLLGLMVGGFAFLQPKRATDTVPVCKLEGVAQLGWSHVLVVPDVGQQSGFSIFY
jgi:hypothetical protein